MKSLEGSLMNVKQFFRLVFVLSLLVLIASCGSRSHTSTKVELNGNQVNSVSKKTSAYGDPWISHSLNTGYPYYPAATTIKGLPATCWAITAAGGNNTLLYRSAKVVQPASESDWNAIETVEFSDSGTFGGISIAESYYNEPFICYYLVSPTSYTLKCARYEYSNNSWDISIITQRSVSNVPTNLSTSINFINIYPMLTFTDYISSEQINLCFARSTSAKPTNLTWVNHTIKTYNDPSIIEWNTGLWASLDVGDYSGPVPIVAYMDFATEQVIKEDEVTYIYHKNLRYAYASSSAPSSTTDWFHMFIDGTNNQPVGRTVLGTPFVKTVNGKPAIAYLIGVVNGSSTTNYVKYANATISTPWDTTDWNIGMVDANYSYPYLTPKIAVVNNNPIITYSQMVSGVGLKQVKIGYGTESSGVYSWNTEFLDTTIGNKEPCPVVTDNTLSIIYNSFSENTLKFGTNAAWNIHTSISNPNSSYGYSSAATLSDGKPAFAYCVKNNGVTYLKFRRATVINPVKDTDWVEMDVDSSAMIPITPGAFSHPSLKVLGGKPCISYGQDASTPKLKYARAIIDNPSFTSDWVTMDVATNRAKCTATSLEYPAEFSLIGMPTYYPVIAYQSTTGIGFAYASVTSPSTILNWSNYPILTVPNGTAPSIAVYKVSNFAVGPIVSYYDSVDCRVYTIKSGLARPANTYAWGTPVPVSAYYFAGVVNPNHAITSIKCTVGYGYPMICFQLPMDFSMSIYVAQSLIEQPSTTADWQTDWITSAYGNGLIPPEPSAMSFNLASQGIGKEIGFSYRNSQNRIAYASNIIGGVLTPASWKFENVRPDLYSKTGLYNSLTYVNSKPGIVYTLDNPTNIPSIRFAQKQ